MKNNFVRLRVKKDITYVSARIFGLIPQAFQKFRKSRDSSILNSGKFFCGDAVSGNTNLLNLSINSFFFVPIVHCLNLVKPGAVFRRIRSIDPNRKTASLCLAQFVRFVSFCLLNKNCSVRLKVSDFCQNKVAFFGAASIKNTQNRMTFVRNSLINK